jgi:hypothetical protein
MGRQQLPGCQQLAGYNVCRLSSADHNYLAER